MIKKNNIRCVLFMVMWTLVAASNSCLSARVAARELTGWVVVKPDRTALDGVMIYIDGGLAFGPAGAEGRFYIRDVPATKFRLNAGRMGFMPREVDVSPAADTLVIQLAVAPVELDQAKVNGAKRGKRHQYETAVSLERVSPREIQNSISAGGDVLRSLQTLPSVAVANDFSSQLYIRGGSPEQNAVLLDGVPVFAQKSRRTSNSQWRDVW